MSADTWLSLSKYALYIGTGLVAIGTIGVSHFSSVVDRVKDQKIDKLLDGNRTLQSGNQELLGKVEKYQSDLEAKQGEIERLKTEAIKASRGVVSTWDFNGVRREGRAGVMNAIMGEEVAIFEELVRLERGGEHARIVELATTQIRKTPDWLTPYLFRGIAYARLGKLQEAKADLEHVVRNSAGDKAYAEAGIALQQLKAREK